MLTNQEELGTEEEEEESRFKRSVSQIKSELLAPALNSKFMVEFDIGSISEKLDNSWSFNARSDDWWWSTILKANNLYNEKLSISCSDAALPGSSLMTMELTDDHHGVTEKHVHRRQYDQSMDFTFYVSSNDYLPILFFEGWMDHIVGQTNNTVITPTYSNYFYRMKFPEEYKSAQGLKVTAFDKEGVNLIEYTFVDSFPTAITSMPLSYSSSDLLKCTVSMSYLRYVITKRQLQSFGDNKED